MIHEEVILRRFKVIYIKFNDSKSPFKFKKRLVVYNLVTQLNHLVVPITKDNITQDVGEWDLKL